ncbi:hypothetical protein HZD82_22520, partial [Pantoea agglomerans]|uniref:hypothetical protein n=1 Tax=Enterobacter agglomerans TaxID=549 RepID=UPI001A8CBA63
IIFIGDKEFIGTARHAFALAQKALHCCKRDIFTHRKDIKISGVLVHPNFVELMAKAAQGQAVEFAYIPVTAVKYTYTVIPA